MSVFMLSLAGLPPLAGWFAKFVMFRSVLDAGTPVATVLGVIAAVISVVAFMTCGSSARCGSTPSPTVDASPLASRSRSTPRSASVRRSCWSSACTRSVRPHRRARRRRLSPTARARRSRRADPPERADLVRAFVEAALLPGAGFFAPVTARAAPAGTSSPVPRSARSSAVRGPALDQWWPARPGSVRRDGGRRRHRAACHGGAAGAPERAAAVRYVLVERSLACARRSATRCHRAVRTRSGRRPGPDDGGSRCR